MEGLREMTETEKLKAQIMQLTIENVRLATHNMKLKREVRDAMTIIAAAAEAQPMKRLFIPRNILATIGLDTEIMRYDQEEGIVYQVRAQR